MTADKRWSPWFPVPADWELCRKALLDTAMNHHKWIETTGLVTGSGVMFYMLAVVFIVVFLIPPQQGPLAFAQNQSEFKRRVEDHLAESRRGYEDLAVAKAQIGQVTIRLALFEAKLDALAESQQRLQAVAAGQERSLSILLWLVGASVLGAFSMLGHTVWASVMKKAQS